MIFRSLVFAFGFALGAVAQGIAQAATPAPAPVAPPTSSSAPVATPLATLTPEPASPTPTPTPTATAQSPYKYIVEPTPSPSVAPDSPQIVRIEISDQTLHPGGPLAVRITTSANVKRVWASTEGQNLEIVKAQDGIFAGLTTLPGFIPPWFLKTYQVTFTAMTADGKRATLTIPVTLAR